MVVTVAAIIDDIIEKVFEDAQTDELLAQVNFTEAAKNSSNA